jgi:hypothetical protein
MLQKFYPNFPPKRPLSWPLTDVRPAAPPATLVCAHGLSPENAARASTRAASDFSGAADRGSGEGRSCSSSGRAQVPTAAWSSGPPAGENETEDRAGRSKPLLQEYKAHRLRNGAVCASTGFRPG